MTAQSEGDSVVEDPAAASGGKKDKKDRKSSEDNIPTDKEVDHLSARLIFESSALHNNSSLR